MPEDKHKRGRHTATWRKLTSMELDDLELFWAAVRKKAQDRQLQRPRVPEMARQGQMMITLLKQLLASNAAALFPSPRGNPGG